jgi:hypothetical protein
VRAARASAGTLMWPLLRCSPRAGPPAIQSSMPRNRQPPRLRPPRPARVAQPRTRRGRMIKEQRSFTSSAAI